MYLYRAVFNIYLGLYDQALKDLQMSWKQHFLANQQAKKEANPQRAGIDTDEEEMFGKYSVSQLMSPMASIGSHQSQRTDLSEVGLCSLNVCEYSLNQMILLVQMKNWPEALKKVNELLSSAPQSGDSLKNLKQVLLVRALIYLELGHSDKHS